MDGRNRYENRISVDANLSETEQNSSVFVCKRISVDEALGKCVTQQSHNCGDLFPNNFYIGTSGWLALRSGITVASEVYLFPLRKLLFPAEALLVFFSSNLLCSWRKPLLFFGLVYNYGFAFVSSFRCWNDCVWCCV